MWTTLSNEIKVLVCHIVGFENELSAVRLGVVKLQPTNPNRPIKIRRFKI